MRGKGIYFPGLNGIRCIAAFSVILAHVEVYKQISGIPHFDYIIPFGSKAVSLFFVLSGFLITYLLLSEISATSTIDLKKFYIRRILRIWPLYFFMTAIGFFILPVFFTFEPWDYRLRSEFFLHLLSYVFLAPNLMYFLSGPIPFVAILWSVGVEEQFYIVWPVLIRRFKAHPLVFLCSIVIIFIAIRIMFGYFYGLSRHYGTYARLMQGISAVLYGLQFECMAIGGIGAWMAINKKGALKIIFRKEVQILNLAAILLLIGARSRLFMLEHTVYGILFAIFILNISCNSASILNLENRIFNFMGRISYGLYVYHSAVLTLMLVLTMRLNVNFFIFNIFLYAATILLTILISSISYLYFEKRFLDFKRKFERIKVSLTAGI